MKQKLWMLLLFLYSVTMVAQKAEITGIVTDSETGKPVPKARITLKNQGKETITDSKGSFIIKGVKPGVDELIIKPDYKNPSPLAVTVFIKDGEKKQLGKIVYGFPKEIAVDENDEYVFSETQIDEDNNQRQRVSILESENDDIYLRVARYSFSPMRFTYRGYNQEYSNTYINGVNFNDGIRGRFNFSMLGGLNSATKSKDISTGSKRNDFNFGGLGGNTNILTYASKYAAGTKGNIAYTNRMYNIRAQVLHATGLNANGWAFAGSAVVRWADEGITQGTFYKSAGYFLAAEKIFNPKHSLSLVTFGAPTQRSSSGAVTQETYNLAGSIYYNPYWGYQDGKKRNSRIVESYDPTLIISHLYKISNETSLRSGIGIHYNLYSNSALTFYNAPDPRPDYYRQLPSFQTDSGVIRSITSDWANDPSVSQINWAKLYDANYKNNLADPSGNAKYAVERRHSNLLEATFNSTLTSQLTTINRINVGIEAKVSKAMYYKTMDDLLGANQWIDVDQYAERDNPANKNVVQNDLRNPNRVIKVGDKFGYNYNMNVLKSNAYFQSLWSYSGYDLYVATKLAYQQFYREGLMDNGRALPTPSEPNGSLSYGKGQTWWFLDPSVKFGMVCKADGHRRFTANFLAESRAPLANSAYISPRVKDTRIPNLESEKIISYDLGYTLSFPNVQAKFSAYQTFVYGTSELFGYYDDQYQTFVNQLLTKADKVYQGIEGALKLKLNSKLELTLAGTIADYHYANNATAYKNFENGSNPDVVETILTNGLKENSGPQLATSVKINYFHPKMWFADISANYFDNNYLDFSPNRFSASNMSKYEATKDDAVKNALGTQEKLSGGFMVDASLGKLIYLPKGKSININLSISNMLNNTKMITGGYQQARITYDDAGGIDKTAINRFPSKYYYAWGANVFLNIGFKY